MKHRYMKPIYQDGLTDWLFAYLSNTSSLPSPLSSPHAPPLACFAFWFLFFFFLSPSYTLLLNIILSETSEEGTFTPWKLGNDISI